MRIEIFVDGQEAHAGDSTKPFSIQGMSKLFTLNLATREVGESLRERIGREPSGNPFNSLLGLQALEMFTARTGLSIF